MCAYQVFSLPLMILRPDKETEATIAPLRRQIEQSQRLGLTIPSGNSNSSTTDPQWHDALCFGRISVGPTFLIIVVNSNRRLTPAISGKGKLARLLREQKA